MAANDVPCCESMFWVYLVICVVLVCFAGLMSGLTLGLMSLSLVDLEVLIKAGQPEDRKNAEKILPIVKNQHLLLCTLLMCNSLAMEALPIFLDALLPAWASILISVTLILAFGEIIPQAVCSRYGLRIGAKLSPLVRLLVIVVFPISYPISKLLDLLLGKGHSALLRRAELKTLVDLHGNEAGKGGELTRDETTIIAGALDLTQKTVRDAMTPLSGVFSLDLNSKLDDGTMSVIISKGHSRVPVYSGSPSNIVGLILVKNLIKCRPEDETPIWNLTIRNLPRVLDSLPLYDLLNQFQKGHSHMAVVLKSGRSTEDVAEDRTNKGDSVKINTNPYSSTRPVTKGGAGLDVQDRTRISPSTAKTTSQISDSSVHVDGEVIGIITMEDVLEELLQEPIFDETDEYIDVHNKIKVNMLPSMTLLARSPGATSSPHRSGHTPIASPFHQTPSSYNHTPILRSPVSPCIQSPVSRPALAVSPGYSTTSPVASTVHTRISPSSHQVSRKLYEKLRKPTSSEYIK